MKQLDDLDKRILDQLASDASMSNQDLALKVHASAPTCMRRVKQLKDQGVIRAIRAEVDPKALGYPIEVIVEVSLDIQNADYMDAFEKQVRVLDAVRQCYRVSPGPDFILLLRVASMADYHQFVHQHFTTKANVRNVRAFFSSYRSK